MKIYLLLILLTSAAISGAQSYIANYSTAKESVIRDIPRKYIDKARKEFKIAYQHTSHGTHVSYGLYGLPDYKSGDETLFAISKNKHVDNKLAFYDYALEDYAEAGVDATDLSRNDTAFIQATRNFLDNSDNSEINVVMWAWCNIAGHDLETNYLPGMQMLIDEYGSGGSKIGTGAGKREVPVHFIFMTGHARANNNIGDRKPKQQADIVTDYCEKKGYYCLDYFSIDSHDMNDNYYPDCGDDGDSKSYGGNYYLDYQNNNTLGKQYYNNKKAPSGDVIFGAHNTQHITANRKAYAMWWILARLAGWNSSPSFVTNNLDKNIIHYDRRNKRLSVTDQNIQNAVWRVYSLTGSLVLEKGINSTSLSLRNLKSGLYIVSLSAKNGIANKKIVVQQ